MPCSDVGGITINGFILDLASKVSSVTVGSMIVFSSSMSLVIPVSWLVWETPNGSFVIGTDAVVVVVVVIALDENMAALEESVRSIAPVIRKRLSL